MSLGNSDNVKKKVKVGICSQLSDGRYLNATDSDFLEIVSEDVQNFQEKGIQSSVLVFPPFNNYHRFLIHKLVEDNFEELTTFSVGQSSGRRTVVCHKEQLRRQESINKSTCVTTTFSMGVERHNNSNEDQDSHIISNCPGRKKVKSLPDVAIYRPPALRKSDEGPSASSTLERKPKPSKQRRPDIAVYVPRALRGTQNAAPPTQSSPPQSSLPQSSPPQSSPPQSSSPASTFILKHLPISAGELERNSTEKILSSPPRKTNILKKRNCISIQPAVHKLSCNDDSSHVTHQCLSSENSINIGSDTSFFPSSPATPNSQSKISKDSLSPSSLPLDTQSHDQVVYNSLGATFCSSPPTSRIEFTDICNKTGNVDHLQENGHSVNGAVSKISSKDNGNSKDAHDITITCEEKTSNAITVKDSSSTEVGCCQEMAKGVSVETQSLDTKQITICIDENMLEEIHFAKPVDLKDKVMGTAGSSPAKNLEIPGKNNAIIVGKINSTMDEDMAVQSENKESLNITRNSDQMQSLSPEIGCVRVTNFFDAENGGFDGGDNDSEGDGVPLASWEELFDLPEDGIEVTKVGGIKKKVQQTRKLVEEVVTAVGKVSIVEKPKSDYTQYRTDSGHALAELSHVVEVYGFPSEFKTQDLISVLSPYGGGNSCAPAFEIKWVDDTHALAVFASSFVAADVLNLRHPMVKTRALEEACAASKTKARKTCDSLRIPFRPRPETCAALAQRLITGALGVHHRQSKAEREEERRLLREAREKRRNAAKERDAAWEGTIGSAL